MSYHGMFVDTSGASPRAMAQKPRRQAEVDVRWGNGEPPDCKQNASIMAGEATAAAKMAQSVSRTAEYASKAAQDGPVTAQGGLILAK